MLAIDVSPNGPKRSTKDGLLDIGQMALSRSSAKAITAKHNYFHNFSFSMGLLLKADFQTHIQKE
jgi:hypothetical protein